MVPSRRRRVVVPIPSALATSDTVRYPAWRSWRTRLERDRVIERVPHPDGRIKAMRLTSTGRRALEAARPLWGHAQDKVLRELGTRAWEDARRRLAQLLRVAVKRRGPSRGRRRVQPRRAPRKRSLVGPLRQSAVIESVQGSASGMIASAQ